MRKFLYFLSPDAGHLQTRLERLANRGLELEDTEGLFSGTFRATERQDLRYLVLPCGRARHFPRDDDVERYGWALAGGFNGMAIFKSIPCRDTDEAGLKEKLRQDGCLRPDRWTLPVLLLGVLAWAVLLFWGGGFAPEPWYLSYRTLGLWAARGVAVALVAANLATLRSYASAWVHGLTPWVMVGSFLLLFLATMLDETAHTLYFAGFVGLIGLACALTLWMRSRGVGLSLAGVCALVLCLGLLFPNVSQTSSGGSALHYQWGDAPVVQLSDLGVDDTLNGSSYETEGTVLVRSVSYWEMTENDSISSQVYRCLTGRLAQSVLDRALNAGSWTATDDGWTSREGRAVLLRQGNDVALVTYSQTLTQEQITAVREAVF